MTTTPRQRRTRAWLAAAGIAAGLTVGTAGIAGAATSGSSSTSSTSSSSSATAPGASASTSRPPIAGGAAGDPATLTHGPGETLLTGTTAAKVKAAALAAVPGATVIRVETDSGGSAYEAHLKKADGTEVTAKLDTSFKVTAVQTGFGTGPSH